MRLRLFGSLARGEAGHDVDLVAEFDRPLSLIELVGLENRLSGLLGRAVDMAVATGLRRGYPTVIIHLVRMNAVAECETEASPNRTAMSIEEELHEKAEHARDPFDKRVAATMAIIAAALAVVSVLGHICTTEEIVLQQRAADQWAFSQAKDIRRYESELAMDVLKHLPAASAEADKYKQNLARYERETAENRLSARELESERDTRHKQALRLHSGEVFLEISIVLASLAILTKRRMLWLSSIGCSGIGLIIASTTLLIR